jgi:hypothetical protein
MRAEEPTSPSAWIRGPLTVKAALSMSLASKTIAEREQEGGPSKR